MCRPNAGGSLYTEAFMSPWKDQQNHDVNILSYVKRLTLKNRFGTYLQSRTKIKLSLPLPSHKTATKMESCCYINEYDKS